VALHRSWFWVLEGVEDTRTGCKVSMKNASKMLHFLIYLR
jgi:hypothetical protein